MDKTGKLQLRILIVFIISLIIFTIISGIKAFSNDEITEYKFDLEDIGNLSLKEIHYLHPNLTKLGLSSSDQDDISDIQFFTKLKELDLTNNPYMTDISPLTALTNLRSLKATWNPQIEDWSILLSLPNLKELKVTKYPNLDFPFVKFLYKLSSLEVLELWED